MVDCVPSAGADVVLAETKCFISPAGASDPQNQIASTRSSSGSAPDDLVVLLGAADLEALKVAAETVTAGDLSYVGPLAGILLGLP